MRRRQRDAPPKAKRPPLPSCVCRRRWRRRSALSSASSVGSASPKRRSTMPPALPLCGERHAQFCQQPPRRYLPRPRETHPSEFLQQRALPFLCRDAAAVHQVCVGPLHSAARQGGAASVPTTGRLFHRTTAPCLHVVTRLRPRTSKCWRVLRRSNTDSVGGLTAVPSGCLPIAHDARSTGCGQC